MLLVLRLHQPHHAVHGPDLRSVSCIPCPALQTTTRVEKRFLFKYTVTPQQALTLCRACGSSPDHFLVRLISFLLQLPFSRTTEREFEMRDTVRLTLVIESCPLLIDWMWCQRISR